MSSIAQMPGTMSIQDWEAAWAHREDAYELVDGIPTVAPSESWANRRAGTLLTRLLDAIAPGGYLSATDVDVALGPRTVRRPDVVVARAEVDRQAARFDATALTLVAEIVSPSSIETDWIRKRADYARAGIPAYLLVDFGDETRPARIALFEQPEHGDYVTGSTGSHVVVTLGGRSARIGWSDLQDA